MAVQPSPMPVPPANPVQETPIAPQPKKPGVRNQTIVLTVILLIVIALAVGVIFYFDQLASLPLVQRWLIKLPKTDKQNIVLPPTPHTPTPKPTPSYLPPGKSTYQINQALDAPLPKIEALTLDPIDVKNGGQQQLEVNISSATPIKSVNISLYADDKQKQKISLTQASIEGNKSVWTAEWTVQYSVWYRYVLMITAVNDTGENKVYVAPRTVGPIKKTDLE